ncbi:DUF4199 domain-containing protein [Flavobacterium sp. RHBU_3]|uniref:DUF4199 domain-containing protein n=1 Tax=Flavobacterium sp. RHBU_3 TaxID=3391184 RepID=UPI003984CFEC
MNEAVKKNGITFGLVIGGISVVLLTLMYAIDLKLFVNMWIGILTFFVNLAIGIYAIAKVKKAQGGYASFKEAFTTYFIVMLIGAGIYSIYTFFIFNVIDPDIKPVVTEHVVETTAKMMQGMGAKTADITKTLNEIRKADSFSIVALAKSYIWGLIMHIIIALIVAAVMKKQDPFGGMKPESPENIGGE